MWKCDLDLFKEIVVLIFLIICLSFCVGMIGGKYDKEINNFLDKHGHLIGDFL